MERDSWPMRRAAAEARRVLLEMGSAHLGVPVDQLAVGNAAITVNGDSSKRVTYGELIGGKKFNIRLTGTNVNAVTGVAKVKPVQELQIHRPVSATLRHPRQSGWFAEVGRGREAAGDGSCAQRKASCRMRETRQYRRILRARLPGFIKVVSKGNYVAVVCEREEQAINAASQLKIKWEKPATAPFPASEDLFNYMRGATPTSISKPIVVGNPDAAFAGAAKVIEADYEVPFQGHTAISPAHALADPSNGQMTVYSNDMKSYGMRRGRRHVSWHAARSGTRGLDGGTARIRPHCRRRCRMRGGLYCKGNRPAGSHAMDAGRRNGVGHEGSGIRREDARRIGRRKETWWLTTTTPRSADYNHLGYNEPDTVLIAQLMGVRRDNVRPPAAPPMPSDMYAIPHRRMAGQVVSLPLVWETPVRTGNLRDPNGPQSTFAAESFIDELAAAAKADPLEFRMKMLMAGTDDDRRSVARGRSPPQGRRGNLRLGLSSFTERRGVPGRS